MPAPKVDTFELDIAEEIKRKDATYAKEVAELNKPTETDKKVGTPIKPAPIFLIILIALFSSGVIGLICLAYYYFTDSLLPPSQKSVAVNQNQVPKVAAPLAALSKTLDMEIGHYVTGVEKKENGYVISINSYSPVFSYMVKNEDSYIEELALVISPPVVATSTEALASSTPMKIVASSTPILSSTTPTIISTTTEKTSTSTKAIVTKKTNAKTVTKKATSLAASSVTSTTTEEVAVGTALTPTTNSSYFTDVTMSNQNMRVWKKGDQTVVYAFITTDKIALAKSVDDILALKNAIIH